MVSNTILSIFAIIILLDHFFMLMFINRLDLLIFGRDSIINRSHRVDWDTIRTPKQDLINNGNKCENHNQRNQIFKQGENALLKTRGRQNSIKSFYWGSCIITAVRNNGTVRTRKGRSHRHIGNLSPYKE